MVSSSLSSRTLRALSAPLVLAATLFTTPAHAGPTLGADLDLGTSTYTLSHPSNTLGGEDPRRSALYDVGFRIRAGWRFDLGPFFIVPEVGFGYDVERYTSNDIQFVTNDTLIRVLGGARAGWSFPLLPALRFEPAIYGHLGYARNIHADTNGLANDVGLALDLRFFKLLTVGAHLGYDVVTQWIPGAACPAPSPSFLCEPNPGRTAGDGWLAYGVQAGVIFW